MQSFIQTLLTEFDSPTALPELLAAVNEREWRLAELGQLDLDCQLAQVDQRPTQIHRLMKQANDLEQKLGLR
jgi:hypothetical protein